MFIGCSIIPEGIFDVATSTHDEYGCIAEFGALGTWDDKKVDVVLRQGCGGGDGPNDGGRGRSCTAAAVTTSCNSSNAFL